MSESGNKTSDQKAKILHICSNYLISKIFPNFLLCSNRLFGENYLFCPVSDSEPHTENTYVDFKDEIFAANSRFASIVPCFGEMDKRLFFPKRRKILKQISKQYKDFGFDRIMAHSLFTDGWVAQKYARRLNVGYSVFVQNSDINYFFKKFFFLRKRAVKILRDAQSIIFCSEIVKRDVLERYVPFKYRRDIESKIEIIPFGIENIFFSRPGTPKQHKQENELRVITVGTIDENKNQISVAKALKDYSEKHNTEVSYILIGKVADKTGFDELMKFPFVKYEGVKNYEEIIEEYRKSDIFILASIHETFGLVYGEAMTQGVPVIYSKGQGFDGQFAEGEVGCSVAGTDVESIISAIEYVVRNYDKLSENAIKLSVKFRWEEVCEKYHDAILR